MKKVELRAMEQMKYEIIKNLVTNNGNKLNAAIHDVTGMIVCAYFDHQETLNNY